MDDFTRWNEKAPAAKKKSYAGMMFKSQSCWNQQALALPFFLQHVPDSEKCLYSKARHCVSIRETEWGRVRVLDKEHPSVYIIL